MRMIDVKALLQEYQDSNRKWLSSTVTEELLVRLKEGSQDVIIIGFGGTISSGYSPTRETIIPLDHSPAKKEIEYINNFKISDIRYSEIRLCAKDSRELMKEDFFTLLTTLEYLSGKKILITCGTYLLPKISELILSFEFQNTSIAVTGSILPAGFLGSDASQNIWSAITILLHTNNFTGAIFHGRTFTTISALHDLNLHPKETENMVIQYPLSTIPVDGIL